MKLVDLDSMRAHLQMDHDEDDEDIERKIDQASALVLQYLELTPDDFTLDSSEEPVEDSTYSEAFFEVLRSATTLLTQMLYKGEITSDALEHGYLPKPVMNLLYPQRPPAMA